MIPLWEKKEKLSITNHDNHTCKCYAFAFKSEQRKFHAIGGEEIFHFYYILLKIYLFYVRIFHSAGITFNFLVRINFSCIYYIKYFITFLFNKIPGSFHKINSNHLYSSTLCCIFEYFYYIKRLTHFLCYSKRISFYGFPYYFVIIYFIFTIYENLDALNIFGILVPYWEWLGQYQKIILSSVSVFWQIFENSSF